MIKISEKDKIAAFDILLNSPLPLIAYPNEWYRVSELALRILDKEGIEYEVKK